MWGERVVSSVTKRQKKLRKMRGKEFGKIKQRELWAEKENS